MNTKKFFHMLWRLMLPVVAQNLISSVVSTADVMMLSGVSQNALSASSLAGQITFVLTLFYMGLSTGASVLASQYWGKKDTQTISQVQGLALRYSVGVSALFFLAAAIAPGFLMRIFTADGALIELGTVYLRTVSVSYLFMGVSQMLLTVMKSLEQTKTSALISTVCLLCNILLNALSIFVIFPGNETGALFGVAAATAISRVAELALCFVYIRRGKGAASPLESVLRSPRWLKRDFWKCTLPVQANYLVWGCATAAMTAIMGHMGSDMVAANSLASTLRNLVIVGCSGLGTAGSILVGKALGGNELDKARAIGKHIFVWSLLLGAASGAILILLRWPCMAIMELSDSAAGLFEAMLLINAAYCIGKSFNSSLVGGIFCAGGDTRFGFACDTIAMWGVVLPLGYLAAFVWQWPPVAVYFVLCLDEWVKLPFVAKRFFKYKWIKNLTRGTQV